MTMTTIPDTGIDTGTGYGRPAPSHNARLTEVGPGTPMGEAMRRYWHPVASSATLTADLPHRIRVLGEDLVVFRDGQGQAGVVNERCAHRGASLYYGRIEEDGIRCCYHGWKFDVAGRCLEQACEPGGGLRRDVARQPWYPVEERYGLVFAYMGPPDRKPDLPRYDALEDPGEGEQYHAHWPVPGPAAVTGMVNDFNWLQLFENATDPVHVCWLHSTHSGIQMAGLESIGFPANFYDPATISERLTYRRTGYGVSYIQRFEKAGEDGTPAELGFMMELQLPNVFGLPDFVKVTPDARHDQLIWVVPSDDTHFRLFFSIRTADPERVNRFAFGITQNGKQNWELTEEERQRFPGDAEAQSSQGPITLHSEETLATTDRGVVMLRRMLGAMADDVEAGRDPVGVTRGDAPVRHVEAGVYTMIKNPGDKHSVPAVTASV
jgi:phenylpropionate dioxygenase-like ring-hydroxylating dioxygenase large terminal subunit